MIAIGKKDPTFEQRKKKAAMPPMLMISVHPKGDGPPPKPDAPPPPDPARGAMPPAPADRGITLESANFHDQEQNCAVCQYFDTNGNGGVGECTKGVPADFSTSDPAVSWCKYFESGEPEAPKAKDDSAADEPSGDEAA